MLYYLLYPLHTEITFFNVFRYITFRTIYATVTALLLTLILGPPVIAKLRTINFGQYIREDGPATHRSKEGTPTAGGVLLIFAIFISTLLWADIANRYIWIVLFAFISMGVIGFLDDWKKIKGKNAKGITARQKIILQTVVASVIAIYLYQQPNWSTQLSFPFFKNVLPDLGILYLVFAVLVIVGCSDAVNLTDGLDGLAIGLVLIVSATYLLFSYISGNVRIADYLQIQYVAGCGELSVFCGALLGASMGFLWYNAYPAEVFMGDVGSLALGGSLGTVAVITKHEILLALVGGIFVVEALSVILQVGSFKLRGKRIFQMAPLHHHFELKGLSEPKIIVRFWIAGTVLALLAMSTLKLR
jgi:phospho-N-acetylmuramoyl-pentapeptide-transferase